MAWLYRWLCSVGWHSWEVGWDHSRNRPLRSCRRCQSAQCLRGVYGEPVIIVTIPRVTGEDSP